MSNAWPRRIAHLDMDAFFASVELLRYPELRGLPVVVGGRTTPPPVMGPDGQRQFARLGAYTGRGVVTTSTYEARTFGVFSAMGLMKAAQLAPDAYLLPADFESYKHYSRLFKAAVATVSDRIESRGIDEIYIDLSHLPESSEILAQQLKARVFDATGLYCSVGITPNKLLSKIASDLNKPNGITILGIEDVPDRIWPLSINKINGVGPKAYAKLQALGLHTIGEVAQTAPEFLQEHFGLSYASWLAQVCQGHDERPMVYASQPKSISRETTFERNLHIRRDRAQLSAVFDALCARLEQDLQRQHVRALTIGVKVRYADFKTVTRDVSVEWPIWQQQALQQTARQALRRVPFDQQLSVRLLGIKASNLRDEADCVQLGAEPEQLSLDAFWSV